MPSSWERQQRYDDAELVMLALMRNRLAVPEGDFSGRRRRGYSWETAPDPG